MQFTPYIVMWAAVTALVLALALIRFIVSRQEDDNIHLGSDQDAVISKQVAISRKLQVLDRWGQALTVLSLVSGLIIAGVYLNQVFQGSLIPKG